MPRNQIQKSLLPLLFAIMFLLGCGAINPFCGSARPKPGLTSVAPNPVSLAEVEQGLLLTVNGTQFYSVLWNGEALSTTVLPRPRFHLPVPPKLSCTLPPTSPETSVATAAATA